MTQQLTDPARIMSALDLDALEAKARKAYPHARLCDPEETLALITRLRAAEARTAWQPIETAPLDGTAVLAWRADADWTRADVAWYGQGKWWTACGSAVDDQPTHWMPLPAAPEAP